MSEKFFKFRVFGLVQKFFDLFQFFIIDWELNILFDMYF